MLIKSENPQRSNGPPLLPPCRLHMLLGLFFFPFFFLSFQKDHTCLLLKILTQIYQSPLPYKATSINLNSESTQRLIKDYNQGVSWGLYKKSYTSFLLDFRLHWIQLSLMKSYRGIQDCGLRWQLSCREEDFSFST